MNKLYIFLVFLNEIRPKTDKTEQNGTQTKFSPSNKVKPWLTHLKWHNIISFREENLNAPLSNNHEQRKPNNLAKVLKRAEIRPNIWVDKEIRFGRNRMPYSIIRLRLSRSRNSVSKFGFSFLFFKPSFLSSLHMGGFA